MRHNPNFGFLAAHDPIFLELASAAEQAFANDPNTTLIKLRQLAEALAQDVASRCGVAFTQETSQVDLLAKISREIRLEPVIKDFFHTLRVEGNRATHQFRTQHKEALTGLRIARDLAIWYHRTFGKPTTTKFGPFTPPPDPSTKLRALQQQIESLKGELTEAKQRLDTNAELAALRAKEKADYDALLALMEAGAQNQAQHDEALQAQQKIFESRIAALQRELAEHQKTKDPSVSKVHQHTRSKARKTSQTIDLSEELTRILIDLQLQDAGWQADSQDLTYSKGVRPEKGTCKAIAEWPTALRLPDGTLERGFADYVLFHGLTPIGVVEAKKRNANVAEKVRQAERYSRGFSVSESFIPAYQVAGRTIAWPDEAIGHFHIPFVYSCNGRPYNPLQDLRELAGIWHRDVRDPSNLKMPLQAFHSPDGLLDNLTRSRQNAEESLRNVGFFYGFIPVEVDVYGKDAVGRVVLSRTGCSHARTPCHVRSESRKKRRCQLSRTRHCSRRLRIHPLSQVQHHRKRQPLALFLQ